MTITDKESLPDADNEIQSLWNVLKSRLIELDKNPTPSKRLAEIQRKYGRLPIKVLLTRIDL